VLPATPGGGGHGNPWRRTLRSAMLHQPDRPR
jgi:hypothetical protein